MKKAKIAAQQKILKRGVNRYKKSSNIIKAKTINIQLLKFLNGFFSRLFILKFEYKAF